MANREIYSIYKAFRGISFVIFILVCSNANAFSFHNNSHNDTAFIYVSLRGNDTNTGTRNYPLASLAIALRKAREMRRLNNPLIKNGIHILLEKGIYNAGETLFIRPEDSGTPESPTVIESEENTAAVISGGINIYGWEKIHEHIKGIPDAAQGKLYVANAQMMDGRLLEFRQLWVNGNKAVRAKAFNGDSMMRILNWNFNNQTCIIPAIKNFNPSNVVGLEMLIHQWWAIAILRIRAVKMERDSIILSFYQPESRIESEHPWPAPWLSKETGNSAFNLINSLQFLDEQGEWYLDKENKKIYYWPRDGEDMVSANVVAPALTTLVKIEGTADRPVTNIVFKNISFNYSTWMRPSLQGHVPLQAGMYLLDAYKLNPQDTKEKKGLENQAWIGRPPAAVEVCYANHLKFERCKFKHLASTGLDFVRGTHDDVLEGNLLKDIGGTGIQIGVYSDKPIETHLSYNPSDKRDVCTNELIKNNLVTDIANEDWGCVGISAGYVKNIQIEHNEVSDVSYSGICVGWGWTKNINAMSGNRIYANKVTHYAKRMYDVGGIYTLSAQPQSIIENNYIDSIYKAPYPHDPKHWYYFYLDEGSSYITLKNNWSPEIKVMKNSNGPGNQWINNGPSVIKEIRDAAGLEPQYKYLLQEKTVDNHWPINHADKKIEIDGK
ncbi:MAG: right-handed parallel beta-helix repeat-containing protein [Arachidicoccus sp.]|nr:right-handed parallel beta-helix repeat-containing protein [Arachidicoccus sp.]